jgi:hypothetical protein
MDSLKLPLTMEDLLFYSIIAGCIGFAVIFIIVSKRSRQGFIDAAHALGYFSAPRFADDIHGAIEKFRVFQERGLFNPGPVAQKKGHEFNLSVFNVDIHWMGRDRHRVTIAHVRLHDSNLPDFVLRTISLARILSGDDLPKRITFDGHPEFSKRLVLESENESAIRAFFAPRIIGFFDKKRKVWMRSGLNWGPLYFGAAAPYIEARGNEFIFFFESSKIAPKKLGKFIDETIEVIRVFSSA